MFNSVMRYFILVLLTSYSSSVHYCLFFIFIIFRAGYT